MLLKEIVQQYNESIAVLGKTSLQTLPVKGTLLENTDSRIVSVLSDLTLLQMILLQNERELAVR